ncbi:hypothetical protein CFK41_14485 [Brachybacterium ginsengisoli]|uniref:Uncharacterized protein n=1 Tax=Brachybacterium ginsengisoli TaxID=1331682 RepID=A0A291H051_9MICO|nr:hypothetical protein [Brachybacterium ginsengisoli]ATG55849.1 hypothetical protein CFK41_14485 [Brachybacterium ginsengisoli]
MVIFRGWGGLAAAYVVLALILCAGVASTLVPESALPFTAAVGLFAAAAATWFTGQALNQTRPQKKIDAWYAERQKQLDELVDSGRFLLGAGQPPPTSLEEAQTQADELLENEYQQARRSLDVHTLFFLPMQYWAPVMAVAAVVVLVAGIMGVVGG